MGSNPTLSTVRRYEIITSMAYNSERLRPQIEHAIQTTNSMRQAAASIRLNYSTFTKYAKRFGLWTSNQGGRGNQKPSSNSKIPLDDILKGMHPAYKRGHLKSRLLKAGIKKNVCERCDTAEWMNSPLVCHLDHKNGDPYDHRLENLQILCPNCHSQTETYCGRNITLA